MNGKGSQSDARKARCIQLLHDTADDSCRTLLQDMRAASRAGKALSHAPARAAKGQPAQACRQLSLPTLPAATSQLEDAPAASAQHSRSCMAAPGVQAMSLGPAQHSQHAQRAREMAWVRLSALAELLASRKRSLLQPSVSAQDGQQAHDMRAISRTLRAACAPAQVCSPLPAPQNLNPSSCLHSEACANRPSTLTPGGPGTAGWAGT